MAIMILGHYHILGAPSILLQGIGTSTFLGVTDQKAQRLHAVPFVDIELVRGTQARRWRRAVERAEMDRVERLRDIRMLEPQAQMGLANDAPCIDRKFAIEQR